MAEMEKTMIDNDGFGGMSTLAGGAGFVGGLVLGSLWNNNGFGGRWNNDNRNDTQSDTIDISLIKGCSNDDRRRVRHDVKSDKMQYIGADKAESQ